MNFITPEHITIALLSVGDCGARQIVQKCATRSDTRRASSRCAAPLVAEQTSITRRPQGAYVLLISFAPYCRLTDLSGGHHAVLHARVNIAGREKPLLCRAGWVLMRRPSRRTPLSASSESRRARARPSGERKW